MNRRNVISLLLGGGIGNLFQTYLPGVYNVATKIHLKDNVEDLTWGTPADNDVLTYDANTQKAIWASQSGGLSKLDLPIGLWFADSSPGPSIDSTYGPSIGFPNGSNRSAIVSVSFPSEWTNKLPLTLTSFWASPSGTGTLAITAGSRIFEVDGTEFYGITTETEQYLEIASASKVYKLETALTHYAELTKEPSHIHVYLYRHGSMDNVGSYVHLMGAFLTPSS